MLKYAIRKGRPLNFTEGMCWSEELKEFEFAARMAPAGDADAYCRNLEITEDPDDIEDILDDLEKDLNAFEEGLMDELKDGDNGDNSDDEDLEYLY